MISDALLKEILRKFLQAQDRLVVQASDLSLETIAAMVDAGSIDIQPAYQRRERWDQEKQSALIESFILNIPVPPIYLAEDDFGRYSVIDGKQRITSIFSFLKKKMKLLRLETMKEIDGLTFEELPREIQNALAIRPYVRVVTLLKQSDPVLKYEVFTRLNRGGEPLNSQEIRNVLFRGPLNDLIFGLGSSTFLKKQLKITNDKSPAFRNMTDAEYVLRFLTLESVWKNFAGSLSRSMDDFMAHNQNAGNDRLEHLRRSFIRNLDACAEIWGDAAFKRPVDSGWRDQMIAGMYDAQMIALAQLSSGNILVLANHRSRVLNATRKLFLEDRAFEDSVRQATNTPSRIKYRVTTLRKMLERLL